MAWSKLFTGRHITDAYLLALAAKNGGRFVTLDKGISVSAVQGALSSNLVVINTQIRGSRCGPHYGATGQHVSCPCYHPFNA
ncbi:MAG: hypothetical protein Q7U28_07265 [Aquabacterium sp.]|nr:hypothetical protein [Aquabacterium sp.]